MDDNLYLSTYEAALAVVATSMKKARLRIDTLIINSIIGGMLFTSGGMLHVLIEGTMPEIYKSNPGIIYLLQGLVWPIGLTYVVILGVDLFNSNILFFSAGLCRKAISVIDLIISWTISYAFNLVGTIFVCYVICHYSHATTSELYVQGSTEVILSKTSFSFVQNLIKAIAGNFYVCLAIYLQLMAKPIHVKFIMMVLPIFTFVSMGFTHSVADMYLLIIGLINKAPVSVGLVVWKVFIPGAIGNIIGGSFFGVVITYYLHIVVVERDRKELNLPNYEMKDEQPYINQDSRVIRQKKPQFEEEELTSEESSKSDLSPDDLQPKPYRKPSRPNVVRRSTSRNSSISVRSRKSPKNVFPVYGMRNGSKRERSIAGEIDDDAEDTDNENGAEYIGNQLARVITGRRNSRPDLEARPSRRSNIEIPSPIRDQESSNNIPEHSESSTFEQDLAESEKL
ncbi:unnamed protein product [Candida verbasci]|uniref:Formate/nitrite transporter n=1 Tax=Candida verbasci TaxID=1227364 RepID=A0A9W4U356_9ASCO|nr:unnamed protein product [Candida verbasci]